MEIGIIGFGYVGQAIYSSIKNTNIYINDKHKKLKDNTNIEVMKEKCSYIFVCVNTPEDENGCCEVSNVLEVLEELKDYNGIIIVKSTMPHYFLEVLENLNICYNPEFLNANTAIEDFKNQKYIVLGGNLDVTKKVVKLYENYFDLPNLEKFEFCSIKEASDFKYIRNIYSAYKLLFWEFVEDTTNNSRKMAQMMKNIPTSEMDIVGLDGFRGFGGACLPKDTKAWDCEKNHKLTKFILDYNQDLK